MTRTPSSRFLPVAGRLPVFEVKNCSRFSFFEKIRTIDANVVCCGVREKVEYLIFDCSFRRPQVQFRG